MTSTQAIKAHIDSKTKPIGALGQLETLAAQICRVQNRLDPVLTHPALLVFAADHGIAQAGVSAYPAEVTAQMVLNFVAGGAAVNVFCRQHGLTLEVVDAGVATDFDPNLPIHHAKVAKGTRSFVHDAAMTREQLAVCRERAAQLVAQQHARGCNVIGFGEMGIGNTSSAALIMHYLTGQALAECVGRGTGLDDAGLQRKQELLAQARAYHGNLSDPNQILTAVGGFEIAMMAYAMESAYHSDMLIMVDGFIAGAATLLCESLAPGAKSAMIFCHQSAEQGHTLMLQHLKVQPLLKLNLRLGEGSGCALAFPLLQAAVNMVNEMASFTDAGVAEQTP